MSASVRFTVFTKPWKMPLPELGRLVKDLGFEGIELPVRPGFQVEPEHVTQGLPEAARILADCGLEIRSVAGPLEEKVFEACGRVGVPVIRTLIGIPRGAGYLAVMDETLRRLDTLAPLAERHGVTIGIQNHCHREISSVMGVHYLVRKYHPKHVGIVLDFGHCGLAGEQADLALDVAWSHLCLVNLKNACWKRTSGPEAEIAEFTPYWTTGRHGMANWPEVAAELTNRHYAGDVCLTAEYSDEKSVNRLIAEDFAFAKSLFH